MIDPDRDTLAATLTPASPEAAADLLARRRARVEDIVRLILLLLVAVGLRWQRAPVASVEFPGIMLLSDAPGTNDPPSMDELWNLGLTRGEGSPFHRYPRDTLLHDVPAWASLADAAPWWKVWSGLDDITHPPLYLQTLRLWRSTFGDGDVVAIAYSVVWSCVALVFTYLAVRLAAGRAAAFWAGAALAVSPVASYYAIEMRSYALMTAESAAAIWLLVRLTTHGPRWRDVIGLCAVLLACMLTHYFAGPACVAAGIYAMVVAGRRWWRVLAGGAVVAGIWAVVWLPFMLRQTSISASGSEYLRTATPQPLAVIQSAMMMPLRLLAETFNWDWSHGIACSVMLLGVIVVAFKRPAVRPFVVWYLAVVGVLAALDMLRQTQQLSFIRYPAAAQPAAVVFVPVIAACLLRRAWTTHVAGACLCSVVLYTQPAAIRNDAPTFTPAALAIAKYMEPGDVLLLHVNHQPATDEYATDALLLEFSHFPKCFPRDAAILYRSMSPQLVGQLRGRRAWLLSLEPDIVPTQIVPGAMVLATRKFQPRTLLPFQLNAYRLEIVAPLATASATRPSP